MTDSRATQRSKILRLLTVARGAWVPLPQIMECAAQYNARIFELRRMGFCIPAPRSKTINGQKHTWYRVELGSSRPESRGMLPHTHSTTDVAATLFPDSALGIWCDPEERWR